MAKKYDWEWPSTIPILDDHSAVKHEILKQYIFNYLIIRNKDPRIRQFKIAIIDGFCGGGLYTRPGYKDKHEGSPLIVMGQVKKACEEIQKNRTAPFELIPHFIFMDSEKRHLDFAENLTKERFPEYERNARFFHDKFANKYLSILEYLKREKINNAIFLLDQYGYSNVPLHITQTIFHTMDKAEVLLTFAVDKLLTYFTNNPQQKEMLRRVGLLEHSNLENLAEIKMDPAWRYILQAELSKGIEKNSGAKFYTPFFIKSSKVNIAYWFVHLANHLRARSEMVDLHWKMQNHFIHHGKSGLRMFGYDPQYDPIITGYANLFEFDEKAKQQSHESLVVDIPKTIFDDAGEKGIRAVDFFSQVCNQTPATQKMLQESLNSSVKNNEIKAISKGGVRRQKGSSIHGTDILIPEQKPFFYYGNEQ